MTRSHCSIVRNRTTGSHQGTCSLDAMYTLILNIFTLGAISYFPWFWCKVIYVNTYETEKKIVTRVTLNYNKYFDIVWYTESQTTQHSVETSQLLIV